ncbi:hypothetical protein P167DRAFT_162313 [Morchella conica CCBAS932]|uniref:Uncharacterized protein n=1 Tax=Morchella conica CCBAS932 TaxID=1392247 RepID=A0A3N4KT77_9PEZI|nr:hypothetical protein P167DRAFT_162313 [Morchella conica CCBAS932]
MGTRPMATSVISFSLFFFLFYFSLKLGEDLCHLLCKGMCGWCRTIVTITGILGGKGRGFHAIVYDCMRTLFLESMKMI